MSWTPLGRALDGSHAAIPTIYGNVQFRSRLEASWAAFFDEMRWSWEYEPIDCNGWIPDFSLVSVLNAPRPVLVEVKPLDCFLDKEAVDTMQKIDRADSKHEVVLVGLHPVWISRPMPSDANLGMLRDTAEHTGEWAPAPLGIWHGSESETKNEAGTIGFCHEGGFWGDRITGCYDGGCYGSEAGVGRRVQRAWRTARNKVQWKRPSAEAA